MDDRSSRGTQSREHGPSSAATQLLQRVNTTAERPLTDVAMASLHHERVQHALNELLVRIVPEDPDEDDDTANQRLQDAFDHALGQLTAAGDAAPVVPDVAHIARLIDRKGASGPCAGLAGPPACLPTPSQCPGRRMTAPRVPAYITCSHASRRRRCSTRSGACCTFCISSATSLPVPATPPRRPPFVRPLHSLASRRCLSPLPRQGSPPVWRDLGS